MRSSIDLLQREGVPCKIPRLIIGLLSKEVQFHFCSYGMMVFWEHCNEIIFHRINGHHQEAVITACAVIGV
jgi:hypothetical protein